MNSVRRLRMLLGQARERQLVRNTGWSFAGEGARVGIQALYFVLVVKRLDPAGYGAFVGVAALVSVLVPFSSCGWGSLLIKYTAREPSSFARYWGQTLWMTLLTGLGAVAVIAAVSATVFGRSVSLWLPLLISLADVLFYKLTLVSGQAFQAHQRMGKTAAIQLMTSCLRLSAIAGMILLTEWRSPTQWAALYCASSGIAAVVSLVMVSSAYGVPRIHTDVERADLWEGFHFSISSSAQTLYNDIDKTMLARLGTFSATGIYGAAYRVIDLSFFPVRAVMAAAYARFFQSGASGIRSATALARRLLIPTGAYALFASAALFVCARVITLILGNGYSEASDAIRFLSAIPFIRCLGVFASDALSGAGYQPWRSTMQFTVALANIGMNLFLIPIYSWQGAAIASLLTDSILVIGMWTLVGFAMKRRTSATGHFLP